MDKALRILPIVFFYALSISCNYLYSQKLYTTELHWVYYDSSTCKLSFNEKEKLLEWCEHQIPFVISDKSKNDDEWRMIWPSNESSMVIVNSKILNIKNDQYFVVISVGCSGTPCQNIYVFRENKSNWCLISRSKARVRGEIELINKDDKIIFKAKSGQIGEFSF
ncbi:hypothetical protein BWI96_12045 [Siphonobacter sp. SORGH_AS_0500]|uniref:hypothetical protein n=1 Tax=Siphonobacter sp. SORGH_AS_0500 TaxID=1864824 RepID=UPI000CB3D112|nr:hypothetical protein [Siphonobacter sp. SORGH_AS_0500]PKK36144.1 hypothetical protein BWI96_12045 [Siphonobacter sp. SORGH_AS_0500]